MDDADEENKSVLDEAIPDGTFEKNIVKMLMAMITMS